jgi:hypothetical protein
MELGPLAGLAGFRTTEVVEGIPYIEVVGELPQMEVEVLQMKVEEALQTAEGEEERQMKEVVVLQMQGEAVVVGSRKMEVVGERLKVVVEERKWEEKSIH